MLLNYLKIAFRNIIRHKAFSAINIAGLAIGMTCSIFILLWVEQELSYDRFHQNAKEIYRLTASLGDMNAAVTPAVMPPELKSKIPAVKNFARLTTPGPHIFETGLKKFEEARTFYADSTFLSVFSFPLVTGNPATALDRPDAVVLTKDMVKKYFGAENPMGKHFGWIIKTM